MPVSLGNEKLDRKINGGIPDNSIISLVVPLGSDLEIAVQQIIEGNSDKNIIYVSLKQSEAGVRRSFNQRDVIQDSYPQIESLNDLKDPIEKLTEDMKLYPDDSIVFLDSFNKLLQKSSESKLSSLYQEMYSVLADKDISFILYGDEITEGSEQMLSLYDLLKTNSDSIIQLEEEYDSMEKVYYMQFPKLRGLAPKDERISINLQESKLTVDASRGIS